MFSRRAEVKRVLAVVEEDITSFGEMLDHLDFQAGAPGSDDDMRSDLIQALDCYEAAKNLAARVSKLDDVSAVTACLMTGMFALACLNARRAGTTLPEPRPACFVDPRHGMSLGNVPWTSPGGVEKLVPMCAADAVRVARGANPAIRTVPAASGEPLPHDEAGPAYRPWAIPYFGSEDLPPPPSGPPPALTAIIPDVTGMTGHDARLEASRAEVHLNVLRLDPAAAESVVIRQHPAPGTRVARHTPLTVWLLHTSPHSIWYKPR